VARRTESLVVASRETASVSELRSNVTLQINVSAGDLTYCDQTVPALIATHRAQVREVLTILDTCRPQATPYYRGITHSQESEFQARVEAVTEKCESWKIAGLVDRIVRVDRRADVLRALNKRYAGNGTSWSHDHLGHAFSAYFAGWDQPRTRYVAHFDADILLYQEEGYSWLEAALAALQQDSTLLAVSPRIAPPIGTVQDSRMVRTELDGSGWVSSWRLDPVKQGWRSDWFSTRCHLMDLERLRAICPLVPNRGRLWNSASYLMNVAIAMSYRSGLWTETPPKRGLRRPVVRLARRVAKSVIPPFPLPPEVLLYEAAARHGLSSLYLRNPQAWYIHPDRKDSSFLALLPRLIEATARGECPEAQRGVSGIQVDAWAMS